MTRHLLVTNDFPPKDGGIQTMLWELWRRLPPEEVTVLTSSQPGAGDWDRAQPFRVLRAREPLLLPTPSLAQRVNALAASVGAEVIVLDPVLPVGGVARWLELPYVVVMHGSELIGRVPVGGAGAARILRGAAAVVAAGSFPAAETRRLTAGRCPPLTVVPPGVDSRRFRPLDPGQREDTRRRFGLPVGGPVVLGLSRLVRRKGFDVLIDAVARLEGVTLAIGGSGRDLDRLRRRAGGTGTRFLGRISDRDVPCVYAAADVFAMLCRDQWAGLEQEGFGIVFLEAAACGVPQVAGRSGGSADAVVDGDTGFVLDDPRDPLAAAAAIGRALDRRLAPQLGAASRLHAEAHDYDLLAARLAGALAGAAASGPR